MARCPNNNCYIKEISYITYLFFCNIIDGDTLHLTKLKPVRASVDDVRAQINE